MSRMIFGRILPVITAAALIIFSLAPFAWMVRVSFVHSPDSIAIGTMGVTLRNYVDVLTSSSLRFPFYLRNSLIVSLCTAGAVTVLCSMAAYAVTHLRFPGRFVIPIAVLGMSMFPQISIVGFLFRVFSAVGLLNTHAALILPYIALTVPLSLWVNISYFSSIPRDLSRAALIDGAGRLRTLVRIVLPVALPGVFSSFLLVFIQCFNEFLYAIMLTSDWRTQTLPVGIALFEGTHGDIPWGNLMAASVIGSVPLVALTLVFQRYVVAGLTGGAVKG